MRQYHASNPLFIPFPWQIDPWKNKAPIMLLTGSAGAGRSRLAAEKIHGLCLHYPNSTALVLRKTREATKNSIVLLLERTVMAGTRGVIHKRGDHRFEYDNGSILAYGGMKDEQQREQIRSIGQDGSLDWVWMEEANQFAEEDYNEVLARMRGHAAKWRQVILTCNPDHPGHWIYQRLIQKLEARVFLAHTADNPRNPASYLELLKSLTGIQYERLVLGLWKQAEGAVFDEFNVETHVVNDAPDMQFRRVIAGVDWGYTNPGVITVWGVDNDGRMYLLAECYRTGQLIDWWVERAKMLKDEYSIERFQCDPAEPAYIEAFKRAGLKAEGAVNDIAPGVQKIKQRLRVAGDGRPRMFISRSAPQEYDHILEEKKRPRGLLDEMTAYVWPKTKEGKIVKEIPVDDNNHAIDTARYVAMWLDKPHGKGFHGLRDRV